MKSKILLLFVASAISGLVYGKPPLKENLKLSGKKSATLPNFNFNEKSSMLLPPVPWTEAEDNNSGWTYTPGWMEEANPDVHGGTIRFVEKTVGDIATFTFSGTDLECFAESYQGAGSVEIFIDNVSKGLFTQDVQPYIIAQKFASITGLSSGSHELKIVSTADAVGYIDYVGIDYIRFGNAIPGSVTGISLNKTATTITISNTEQLIATVTPADATNKAVTWTVDDPTVATVSPTGVVTPVSVGMALITVTSVDDPDRTATCQVNVVALDLWTKADNADPAWIFNGFAADNCGGCFGGTSHYNMGAVGSTAEYTFIGTNVEAYAEKLNVAGTVEIFIDNVSRGSFAQNTEPLGSGLMFASFTGLSNAPHTIRFVTETTGFSNIDYLRYIVMDATPLTLVSFNGKSTINGNTLTWVTKDELNVKNFEIQRSADGVQFTQIGAVNSKGGGVYNTIDRTPAAGNNYYRLKMVDNNGEFSESNIVFLKDALKQSTSFTIYPNPVKDKVTISPSDKNSLVKVTLFDIQGKKILSKQITGVTEISLENLTKGVYIVQFLNKGEISTLKLLKD